MSVAFLFSSCISASSYTRLSLFPPSLLSFALALIVTHASPYSSFSAVRFSTLSLTLIQFRTKSQNAQPCRLPFSMTPPPPQHYHLPRILWDLVCIKSCTWHGWVQVFLKIWLGSKGVKKWPHTVLYVCLVGQLGSGYLLYTNRPLRV